MINESNNEYLAVVILVQREEAVHVYVLKNEIEWILCIKLKYTFISKTKEYVNSCKSYDDYIYNYFEIALTSKYDFKIFIWSKNMMQILEFME